MVKHDVFGVKIDDISASELEQTLLGWMNDGHVHTIVTPNPEFILEARRDPEFRDILNRADLALPDGVGLKFAVSALTGKRLLHRHTGVDTLLLLSEICTRTQTTLHLIGGNSGVVEIASNQLRSKNPTLSIQCFDPGLIEKNASAEILTKVADRLLLSIQGNSVLAIGLGQKKQERLMSVIAQNLSQLPTANEQPPTCILIGVGGSFDMIAGTRRRAPAWLRRIGLEWVWRLMIEPRRWRRIANAVVIFPALVISDTLKHRRFLRACRKTIPEIVRQFTE